MSDPTIPNNQTRTDYHPEKHSFPVVGLGASAGGLKALLQFFELMPASSGMAFVVILHLSPDHESHSADLLQNVTEMPVTQVNQSVRVEPNRVYVIPPTKHLQMNDGVIDLKDLPPGRTHHVAIDLFFRTLADAHRDRAVCVVLSGTGSDGTVGLTRVKEQGGLALAQSPDEAEYDGMPRNAIGTGVVDFVLPVAEMPNKLIQLWQNASVIKLPPAEEQIRLVDPTQAAEDALRQILLTLRARTGHDFIHYKRATVLRRIERRMQVNQLPDLPAYLNFLRQHQEETPALLRDMLISVTNFFRDREAFETLEREVIPRLFAGKTAQDQVRVWVTGCATGEEAYSIAMLLLEHAAGMPQPPAIQVFATDIDEHMVMRAREGVYPESITADISPARLRNFFTKEAGGYAIKKSVRERVLFAAHNVLKDPPFSRLDMVSCRNLMIYLTREVQEQILGLFHFALQAGGYLFLGNSESADSAPNLFHALNKKQRLFKGNVVSRAGGQVPTLPLGVPARKIPLPSNVTGVTGEQRRVTFSELHQRLLEQYAPPSVIITHDYDIVHLSDRAGRFLQFAGGEPSHNLLRVIHPELRLDLRTALFQAGQSNKSVEARRVRLNREGRTYYVNMIARPVQSDAAQGGYILVIFDEVEDILGTEGKDELRDGAQEPLVQHLEGELQRTREQLQATIEQFETANEEMQASNEELQAINEELRSTTEELETSKEELQSTNEELMTVNYELKEKVEEITVVNDDLKNLISANEIATIFVDRQLKIKRFTPRALDIFSLIPSDVGRSLLDIVPRLSYDQLAADAEQVLATLQPLEREVAGQDGRWYIARLLPYRTTDDRIAGLVLNFINISERRQVEVALRASEQRLQRMVNVPRVGVLTFDYTGKLLHANDAFLEMVGYDRQEFAAQRFTWRDFTPPEYVEASERILEQLRATGRGGPYEKEYFRKDGSRIWLMFVGADLGDGTLVEYALDISDSKRVEEALRDSEGRLRALVENLPGGAVFIVDKDLRYVVAQGEALAAAGFAAAALVGRTIFEALPPELAADYETKFRQALNGEPFEHEHEAHKRAYISRGVPLRSAGGEVYAALAVSYDITERKRIESLLDKQKRALEMVVGGSPLDDVLSYLARIVEDHSADSSVASLMLLDEQGRLHTAAAPSLPEDYLRAIEGIKADANVGTCSRAAATGQAVITRDIAADPRWQDLKHLPLELDLQAAWSMPIVAADGRVLGTFGTYFRERRAPTELEQQTMEMLTRTAALAIERKGAEERLRQSELRFRATFEQANVGIVQLTSDGHFLIVNPGFCKIVGYTAEELQSLTVRDVTHPDDFKLEQAENQKMLAGEISGYTLEKRFVCQDGRIVWGTMTGTLVRHPSGEPFYMLAIIEDITARKQAEEILRGSEERLRLLIESVKDYAIITFDTERRITGWNAGAQTMFGYTAEEIVGQSVDLLFTPEDRAQDIPEQETAQARTMGHAADDRWHLRQDGTRFYVSGVLSAYRDGKEDGFVKIARDLTARQQTEEELREGRKALEVAVQARTIELSQANELLQIEVGERRSAEERVKDLLRVIINAQETERHRISRELHDHLGQLLTALRLNLESLKRRSNETSSNMGDGIEQAQMVAEQLDEGVDFLAWELRPTALDDLGLTAALSNYVAEWSKHFNVQAEFHGGFSGWLRLAPEVEINLYRIAQEALNNIAKHARAKQVNVLLERRDHSLALIIEDDGHGFDTDEVSARRQTGRGLGLIGMSERAALIGGTVEIESSPGSGTTVFVRVPLSNNES